MKKTGIFIVTIMIIAFLIGIDIYIISDIDSKIASLSKNDELKVNKIMSNNIKQSVITTSSEAQITPKTKIIEIVHYKVCGHEVENILKNEKFVNMTEEEFANANLNYKIKEFTQEKVIIYREDDGFCKEHYLLKDNDGYINIYELDENEEAAGLIKKTQIATQYLSSQDKEQLNKGIKVYSKKELSRLIQDFE